MKIYESKDIRNVALLGHGGSGKTILAEAMALKTKTIDRMGKIEDGSTLSDYDQEEQKRVISISSSLIPLETGKNKINVLDAPGYFDFAGEQIAAMRAADSAVFVVDAVSGVQVGTEKLWEIAQEKTMPSVVVINKVDRENVDFEKAYESVRNLFGKKAIAFTVPINPGSGFNQIYDILSYRSFEYEKGEYKELAQNSEFKERYASAYDEITEAAATASEELMDKYLETGELSREEILAGLKGAISAGELIPVICTSALHSVGINILLEVITNILPSPVDSIIEKFDPEKPSTAFVFKTIADPYVGRLSLFKVINGSIKPGMELMNLQKEKREKINHLYTMRGKKQIEVQALNAGDIGAFSKLSDTLTNQVLYAGKDPVEIEKIDFPKPNIFMAISAKSKNDEDKLGNGLARVKEEDPTIHIEINKETNQTLIYGIGEMQLEVIANKLKAKFSVEVELDVPIIPYRETIKKKATAEGKHKKQSGGSGQYGVVFITFEPTFDLSVDLEFVDKVVGGSVPRQFIPAVEKGLRNCVKKGVLAGYPVYGVRATLFDGKYHPVDSDEMSFVTAASLAYREGMPNCAPVLLEPIYKVSITIPEKYMGDIMGDLNKKRGRIMGMEPIDGGKQQINAEAPLSEMFKYATELRSMTQGRGTFSMEYERYEEVPQAFSEKIIAQAKALKEAK